MTFCSEDGGTHFLLYISTLISDYTENHIMSCVSNGLLFYNISMVCLCEI